MSFKLSELLNPAPKSHPPSPRPAEESHVALEQTQQHNETSYRANTWAGYTSDVYSAMPTTVYEAADALTALATSGTHPRHSFFAQHFAVYPSSYDQYSATRRYSEERPTSSYSYTGAPVVSSPQIVQQPFSPTQDLNQYHHTSRSSDEQRRRSLFTRDSPPPRLAPIQSLTSSLNEGIHQTSAWRNEAEQIGVTGVNTHRDSSYREPYPESSNQIAQHLAALHGSDQSAPNQFHHSLPGPGSYAQFYQTSAPSVEYQAGQSSAQVKPEPTVTPREGTPSRKQSSEDPPVGASVEEIETMKAIAALRNEHGTRTAAKDATRRISETPTIEPPIANPRKRPAPKAPAKKGMAAAVKKPSSKKRKIETSGFTGTPVPRSATPSSQSLTTPALHRGASITGTPSASSPAPLSPAPTQDMSASEPEEGAEVFCICRKPDNHTCMIACDGTCDDWYHGRCVNMDESDGALIDKYICPICQEKGIGNTTWKPMCRNDGCRKPARLKKGDFSKYCSPECGRDFFAKRLGLSPSAKRKRDRKPNRTSSINVDEEDLGPMGGPIRMRDLKALADAAATVEEFKQLGDPATVLMTPPGSATIPSSELYNPTSPKQPAISYTNEERAELARIAEQKTKLRRKRALLKDKERFLTMTKQRSVKLIADFLGYEDQAALAKPGDKKAKAMAEICGYDSRLAWDVEGFRRWREDTDAGKRAFTTGVLDMPSRSSVDTTLPQTNGVADHEDAPAVNGIPPESSATEVDPHAVVLSGTEAHNNDTYNPPICLKKRCERHKQWQKLALHDVRFEEADVGDEMRRIEREERGIVESAVVRERMKGGGQEGGRVERVDVEVEVDGGMDVDGVGGIGIGIGDGDGAGAGEGGVVDGDGGDGREAGERRDARIDGSGDGMAIGGLSDHLSGKEAIALALVGIATAG